MSRTPVHLSRVLDMFLLEDGEHCAEFSEDKRGIPPFIFSKAESNSCQTVIEYLSASLLRLQKTVKQAMARTDCEKSRIIDSATDLSGHENIILTEILRLYQYVFT